MSETNTQTEEQREVKRSVPDSFEEGRKKGQAIGRQKASSVSKQRHAAFVRAYIRNGGNATQAAIDAGYSKHSAPQAGNRLLKLPHVRSQVEEAQQQALETAAIDSGWVIARLKAEAATCPTDSARIKALELLGRVTGAYAPEKSEVRTDRGWWQTVELGQTARPSHEEEEED